MPEARDIFQRSAEANLLCGKLSRGYVVAPPKEKSVRTRLSICARKLRFSSEPDALAAVRQADIVLRHYRCDRCGQFHLTSRTKGKRVPRPGG